MQKLLFRTYIFILLFSPLAFGTVTHGVLAIVEVLAMGISLLLAIHLLRKDKPVYTAPGMTLILIFIVFIVLQLIPLPPWLLRLLSPATHQIYQDSLGVFGPLPWLSLSINPKDTLAELLRYGAYGAIYFATIQFLSQARKLKFSMRALAVFAAALSLVTILQAFSLSGKYLLVFQTRHGFYGPYVNPNHYAGLMEMIFPVVLGLFFYYKPRVSYESLRSGVVDFFNNIRSNTHILMGFACLLIVASVLISLSRGGIISLCLAGMLCFYLIFRMTRRMGKMGINTAFLLFVLVIGFFWFGWEPVIQEFTDSIDENGQINENRPSYWKDSLQAFKTFPLAGSGMGTFRHVYKRHQSTNLSRTVTHAHNDYIEFLVNGGLVGFFLFFSIPLVILWRCRSLFHKRRESYCRLIFIGALSGVVAILIHSLTDFNLQIGANGLYLFFLLGLVVSASHTRLRSGLKNTYLRPMSKTTTYAGMGVAAFLLVGMIPVALFFHIGILKGETLIIKSLKAGIGKNLSASQIQDIYRVEQRAAHFDFLGDLPLRLAANSLKEMGDHAGALRLYQKAIRHNPLNGGILQDTGVLLAKMGRRETARQLMQTGLACDPTNTYYHRNYAKWLLDNGQSQTCIETMQDLLNLDPFHSRSYIDLMAEWGLTTAEIITAVPLRTIPCMALAEFHQTHEDHALAADTYLRSLGYLHKENEVPAKPFLKAAAYFITQAQLDQAQNILLKGIEHLPDNPNIRLRLARLYERQSINYRAIEEYTQILIIDPKNKFARKKLKQLSEI